MNNQHNNNEVSARFNTLFNKQRVNSAQYDCLFSKSLNQQVALNRPNILPSIPFIQEMHKLGVYLFCHGKLGIEEFLFTKTHMLIYEYIDTKWSVVNKPAKYDGTDIWECTGGRLKNVVPLLQIKSINITSGSRVYSWDAITTQKQGDPVKGAIIGGIIAGPTGAVVGAIANSGVKEETVLHAGLVTKEDLKIKVSTNNGGVYEMTAASAEFTGRTKNYVTDDSFYNWINYSLSRLGNGLFYSGPSIHDGSAGRHLSSVLLKPVNEAKEAVKRKNIAAEFWRKRSDIHYRLSGTISSFENTYAQIQQESETLRQTISTYVADERQKQQLLIQEKTNELSSASFLRKAQIKWEIKALQSNLEHITPGAPFDEKMAVYLKDLSLASNKFNEMEALLNKLKKLEVDISSPEQEELLNILMDPGFAATDFLNRFCPSVKEECKAETFDAEAIFKKKMEELGKQNNSTDE